MSPSPEAPPREPKLLDRVRDALRARHMSYRTEKTYVHWTRHVFNRGGRGVQSPADLL